MAELLVILAIVAVAALVFWLRRRSGRVATEDDALTRACMGDHAQARRLEALEQENASEPLTRREARKRALARLVDDRTT